MSIYLLKNLRESWDTALDIAKFGLKQQKQGERIKGEVDFEGTIRLLKEASPDRCSIS